MHGSRLEEMGEHFEHASDTAHSSHGAGIRFLPRTPGSTRQLLATARLGWLTVILPSHQEEDGC